LVSITKDSVCNDAHVQLLMNWRDANQDAFPAKFKVTFEGTRNWTQKQLIDLDDRILFFIQNKKDRSLVGHVGLFRFDFSKKHCEMDNIIRGDAKAPKGIMTASCAALMQWTRNTLNIKDIYLRVMSNNPRAIKLYEQLNFKETLRVPLYKESGANGSEHWHEVVGDPYQQAERYFVTMHHKG
ncbi:MAG: GNAT family N-acetyltransferase, partial [Alphaproteobacteria bacterium]